MAVSSTSSSSTASIDVASIVTQLMTVENKPLDAIKAKITQQQLIISELGVVKSKLSTLNTALTTFQNPLSYNARQATASNTSVATASASNGAAIGSYNVVVDQVATATRYAISDFTSSSELINLDPANGFIITVGNTEYSTKGVIKVNGVVSANTAPILQANPTVSDLKLWINSLGADVSSSLVQTTSTANWSLMIQGKKTGTANGVSSIGLLGHALDTSPGASAVEQNASFTVNGIGFTRSSNTIADAIDGVNLNLVSSAPGVTQTIRVSAGAENSEKMITDMVTAYNDLMAYYTTQTATIANSKTPGTFANQPTMLGFIAQIKSKMANGIRYLDSATGQPQQLSLSAIGMDLQLDGTIKFNSITHAQAVAQGLQAKLAQGGRIGYVDAGVTTSSVVTFAALLASETFTLNGLTIAAGAGGGLTATEVATAFANRTAGAVIAAGTPVVGAAANGTISGTVGLFTTGASGGTTQTFTSTTANTTGVANLGVATGTNAAKAPITTATAGVTATNDLSTFLKSEISFSGDINSQINAQKATVQDMQKRQAQLQTRLDLIQRNYFSQYSNLNSLLFQLSSTSNSLSSALTALTNMSASE